MPMFPPKKQFELVGGSDHYGNPGKYSAFVRELTEPLFTISGVHCHVYRYQGTFNQTRNAVGIKHDTEGTDLPGTDIGSFMDIQDPILGENRDRSYNFEEIPIIKGIYQVSQSELELLRFGFKSNETLSMEFHQGQVERELGRRMMEGDVIELPHLREVGFDGRAANRWYEVKEITWSPGGYDLAYGRHVVGVILQPLRHQQEFLDLFENVKDQYGRTLEEQISNKKQALGITETLQGMAEEQVSTTWWDTTIMWFDPDHPDRKPYRWTDDGTPPNGEPVIQGDSFPSDARDGTWFLRVDLLPNRLYRKVNDRWKLYEVDNKREWQSYFWTTNLRSFMSDRSDTDTSRPYKLTSIHDVITEREHRNDQSFKDIE